jgi:hypothetical protein
MYALLLTTDQDPDWIEVHVFDEYSDALVWLDSYMRSELSEQGSRDLDGHDLELVQQIIDGVSSAQSKFEKYGFTYQLAAAEKH